MKAETTVWDDMFKREDNWSYVAASRCEYWSVHEEEEEWAYMFTLHL